MGLAAFAINGKGYAGLGDDYRDGEHVYYKDFYSYGAERDIWHAIAEFKGEGGQHRGTFTLNISKIW